MATTLRELIAKVVFRADPKQLESFDAGLDALKAKLTGVTSQTQEMAGKLKASGEIFGALRVALQGVDGALDPARAEQYARAFQQSAARAKEVRDAIDRLRLVDPTSAELPKLEKQLGEVEREAKETARALEQVGVGLKAVPEQAPAVDGLTQALKGLATAALAYKVIGWGKTLLAEADAVGKLAARLGIGTDELQVWTAFTAEAGAANEDLSITVKSLSKNIQTVAQTAKGPAADAFKRLGIETAGWAKEMPNTMDVLLAAGGALGELSNDTERLALAQQVLGEGGLKLLPGFKNGTAAAQAQLERLRELAVVYDTEFIESAEAANDEMGIFELQMKGVGVQVVLGVLPALRGMVRWLTPIVQGVRRVVGESNALNAAFTMLGGFGISKVLAGVGRLVTRLGGFTGLLKAGARIALRFLLPFLALDEIITFLTGGETVIGDIIDALFGIGTAEAVVESLHGVFGDLWETIKLVGGALFGIGEAANMSADQLESAFFRATENIGKFFDGLIDKATSMWDELLDLNKEMGPKTLAEAAAIERGEIAPRKLGENRDPRYQKGGELYGDDGRGVGPTFAERTRPAFAKAFPMPSALNAEKGLALGGNPYMSQSKSTTVTVNDNSSITTTLNGVDGQNVGPALRQSERNVTASLKRSKAQVVRQTVGAAGT